MEKGTILATLAALMLTACGGGADEASQATDGNAAASSDVAASTSTGVPECDQLFDEIEKCIANDVPAGQKEAMAAAFNESRGQVAQMAAGDPSIAARSCTAQRAPLKAQYCPQ